MSNQKSIYFQSWASLQPQGNKKYSDAFGNMQSIWTHDKKHNQVQKWTAVQQETGIHEETSIYAWTGHCKGFTVPLMQTGGLRWTYAIYIRQSCCKREVICFVISAMCEHVWTKECWAARQQKAARTLAQNQLLPNFSLVFYDTYQESIQIEQLVRCCHGVELFTSHLLLCED